MGRPNLHAGHARQPELVQLRIKESEAVRRRQIRTAKTVCERHGCQLVINDCWRLAIEKGCDFVHPCQEDLDSADLEASRRAGVNLGFELETAFVVEPDYIALGPIYPTTLKAMKWGRRRGATASPSGNMRRQPSANGHRRACHVAVGDKLDVQKQAPAPKSVHSNGWLGSDSWRVGQDPRRFGPCRAAMDRGRSRAMPWRPMRRTSGLVALFSHSEGYPASP